MGKAEREKGKQPFAAVILLGLSVCCMGLMARPAFFLPETLYAFPGLECNVYYKNIIDSVVPDRYAYQSYCDRGRSELKRWCFTPDEADAGKSFRLVVNAWDDDGLVAAATTTVRVARRPQNGAQRVTLALLGDSLTNCGFQDHLMKVMRACGYSGYEPVGTRAFSPNGARHDGYGGFRFKCFFDRYAVAQDELTHVQDKAEREQLLALGEPVAVVDERQREKLKSPLLRLEDGKKAFDTVPWLKRINGGIPPDLILIELGLNDCYCFRDSWAEIPARIRREVIANAGILLGKLRAAMPKATYFICTVPCGCSQDGFAMNEGATYNEVQCRKLCFSLNREVEAFVRAQNDPKVILLPIAQAIDPFDGYIHGSCPTHARSETKTVRDLNAVHPSKVGGMQLGDAMAAGIVATLEGR